MPAERGCGDLSPSPIIRAPWPALSPTFGARPGGRCPGRGGRPLPAVGKGQPRRSLHSTPRAPARRHSPERPHWRRVGGPARAGAAPGAHWAASCGDRGLSPGPVPRPAATTPCPVPPVRHAPCGPQPPQQPPHTRGHPSRLHLRTAPAAADTTADLPPLSRLPKSGCLPPVLTHRPQCTGRRVGGASGRRGMLGGVVPERPPAPAFLLT